MTAKVMFIGASLLLAAGTAFADDPGAGSASGGAGAEVGVGVGAGGGSGSGSAAVSADASASAAAGAWLGPQLDRPYAMPAGKIGAYGDVDVLHLSVSGGGVTISATQEGLHVGGGFGVNDKITAGVDYFAPIAGDGTDNTAGKGPLAIFGMFQLAHDSKMSIAATADFTANLCGATDMMGSCSVTKAIHAGLGAKYKLGPTMALFTGSAFGPGPVGQHLSISLESSGPITFSLPIGFALQATPQILAWASTELFSAYISNAPMGADSFRLIGGDIEKGGIGIPLTLGALYGVNNQLDVGLQLSFFDLGHAGDFYTVGILGRWHN